MPVPLDRFPFLHSSDLDEVRAAVWRHMGEHPIQLDDPFDQVDARIHGRLIDRITVSYLSFGARVRTEPGELAFYLIQLVESGTYTVRLGEDELVAGPGEVLVLSPNLRMTTRWSADCGVTAYQLRAPDLVGHLSRLLVRPATEPLRFDLRMRVDAGPGRQLHRGILRPLAAQLNQPRSRIDNPVRAQQVENTLMTALLRAQPNTYSDVLARELGWPK
ncbi:cupin domain-containing protein [Jiangella gansuensis]|uniref:cupin domain-containing protein n=1 Tax=Jiangella gansuensis TaxID=281473 RepID=UPI00047EB945|nr:AraC family ligand binding domain-containing protein [Jiangella gansuensis]